MPAVLTGAELRIAARAEEDEVHGSYQVQKAYVAWQAEQAACGVAPTKVECAATSDLKRSPTRE